MSAPNALASHRENGRQDARHERGCHVPADVAEERALKADDCGDAAMAAYWIGYAGEVRDWPETNDEAVTR